MSIRTLEALLMGAFDRIRNLRGRIHELEDLNAKLATALVDVERGLKGALRKPTGRAREDAARLALETIKRVREELS